MNYRVLPEARNDYTRAEARLEREHPGYGTAFMDLLYDGIQAVIAQPALFSPTADGPRRLETREYYIARFKYRLIYAVTATEVVFLAVHHASRRPRSWIRRARGLN